MMRDVTASANAATNMRLSTFKNLIIQVFTAISPSTTPRSTPPESVHGAEPKNGNGSDLFAIISTDCRPSKVDLKKADFSSGASK
jgi:hypothetical protein